MLYPICPVPKPRQTRSDKWKKRPSVMRYRAFADHCRALRVKVPNGAKITFYLPMPKSWSKKQRTIMNLGPHEHRPDIDNLCKALLDAVYQDDSGIHEISIKKRWAIEGAIEIK